MEYKSYSCDDLWDLIRLAYRGVVHWRWDAAHGYYLGDDGKPSGPVNCIFLSYHLLHNVHSPNGEDVHRAACIARHVIENRDAHLGHLRVYFGDEKAGGSYYPRLMIPLAIALKHWDVMGLGEEMRARFRHEFYHYYRVDRGQIEADTRNNQHTASHFLSCAFAYWATGDSLFLDRALELTSRLSYVYRELDLLAARCYYPGCYPDWSWNYMMRDVPECDEDSTHSPVYQNGHIGFWLMGHRVFKLAGIAEFPWLDFLRETMRVCLLTNQASNGLDPYVIEPYPMVERYHPASQIYLGSFAAWAASCPEAAPDPRLPAIARFLYDRAIETIESAMDPKEGLPRDFYHLSEFRDPATGNYQRKLASNYCVIDIASQVASFADLDSVTPAGGRYWDWRWFWDLLHVRGDSYDVHLAGWTNRRTKEPCFVGGTINRLFSSGGDLIFPLAVNGMGWKVETDAGVFESTELCRGRKAPGYSFTVEVDGKILAVPEDYVEPSWPVGFDRIVSRWRVECDIDGRAVGEMIIENAFEPDGILVTNTFLPRDGVRVLRCAQSIPFTRRFDRISWKPGGRDSEESYRLDWFVSFRPRVVDVQLSGVEWVVVEGEEEKAAKLVLVPDQTTGDLVINDGGIGETWPDGWNCVGLCRELVPSEAGRALVQSYRLKVDDGR